MTRQQPSELRVRDFRVVHFLAEIASDDLAGSDAVLREPRTASPLLVETKLSMKIQFTTSTSPK
jgi:hypothetical protein